ncbi:hypothetical protein GDO86_010653 [Hymenochirus boettgeri]|uniref:Olfactory receptor n=1 Tax=Hymenochirus boettgeri TaxID=247094 RepID=A0A8T2JTV6_9PIPI|nr:hypothetical protein GDO86_010653 [Hymenochirus boettgeri]
MENRSQTVTMEFILAGFPESKHIKALLFVFILLLYLFTLVGNIIFIVTVNASPRLHSPMYYFLCHLSLLDLLFSSSAMPKILADMFYVERRISFTMCMIQMHTGLFLGETECFLLAFMAFDRYVAICLPLHYTVIMSQKRCRNIVVITWLTSLVMTIFPFVFKPLKFCKGNRIDHFVCEILPLLELVCANIPFYETLLYSLSLLFILVPFSLVCVSYACILISILKIHSVDGSTKAFSTCASHVTILVMFYGTLLPSYLGKYYKHPSNRHKYISIIYGCITPALNPLIYSLRNNEVKGAVSKILFRNRGPK